MKNVRGICYLLILTCLYSCNGELEVNSPFTSKGAASSLSKSLSEDTESIITLKYSNSDTEAATTCSISNLVNVTETTPCSCDQDGVCSVGVTGSVDYSGEGSFNYTVTSATSTSEVSSANLTIEDVDDAPVASVISPAVFNEDVQSIITLSYTDADSDLAASCNISSLSNVSVTSACSCNASGVCTVGVTGTSNYSGAGSFDYTVTANSAVSNSVAASFTIESLINSSLVNPKYITATPDSVSAVSLFWAPGESSLSNYQIAWAAGSTAPTTCLEGTVVNSGSITGETYQLTGLSTLSDYAFRICVIDGDGKLSTGTTVVQKTLPACDYTVSADETFVDFQTRVDSAVDINTDGKIAICLNDGVDVTTSNSSEGDNIQLENIDNLYIYANRSSTASFKNNRTDSTALSDTSIFFNRTADNFSVANVSLSMTGESGYGFYTWSGGGTNVGFEEISNIELSGTGVRQKGIYNNNRIMQSVKDVTFTFSGADSSAIHSSENIGDLRKFTINMTGTCAGETCVSGIKYTTTTGSSSIYWGDITVGPSSGLYLGSSTLDNFDGVNIFADGSNILMKTNSLITNAKNLYLRKDMTWNGPGLLNMASGNSEITNLENVVIVKNGHGSYGLSIGNNSFINKMDNVQIRRNIEATASAAQAINITDGGWVNSQNVSNIEVCNVSGATPFENYATPSRGLLDGGGTSPTAHAAFVAGTTLGAQTFPFDVLDGSGLQGGAVAGKNIILGGICSD